ncbi:hypothetical protein GW755_02190 [bacterium]|nr:hypothetical protein [bacterium]
MDTNEGQKNLSFNEYTPNMYSLRPFVQDNAPETTKTLIDPFISDFSDSTYIAAAMLLTPEILGTLTNFLLHKKTTRRSLLLGMGIAAAGMVKLADTADLAERLLSYYENEGRENMFAERTLLRSPELAYYKLYLDTVATFDYQSRLKNQSVLESPKQEFSDTGDYLEMTFLQRNKEVKFFGYRSQKPISIDLDGSYLAQNARQFHSMSNQKCSCFLNATSLSAIEWSKAIAIGETEMSKPEEKIVYGSESLFVYQALHKNSPVWEHARYLMTHNHPNFSELTLRPGNKNQHAVVANEAGEMSVVSNVVLSEWVKNKFLPKGIKYAWLPQFCFVPDQEGINYDIPFNDLHHRMLSLLAYDGQQTYLISGKPDYFCTPWDIRDVVKYFQDAYKTKFKFVACTDVGLAGGFNISDDNRNVFKPSLEGFCSTGKVLPKALDHTASVILGI